MSNLNEEEITFSEKTKELEIMEENMELESENKRLNEEFEKLLLQSFFLQRQKIYLKSILDMDQDKQSNSIN
jgi:hypothetical protein